MSLHYEQRIVQKNQLLILVKLKRQSSSVLKQIL